MSIVRDAIENADKVKPIAVKHGTKVASPADAKDLIIAEIVDPTPDIGQRTLNKDGTVARSRTLVSQMNPAFLYDNRYMIHGVKGAGYNELWVIPAASSKGFRTIVQNMEDKDIPVYRISKDKETGEYFLVGITTVDYQKYHSEFTHKLDEESMKRIMPLFALDTNEDITSEKIDDLFK